MSAIFAGMVNQYAQMAFMFLGKVPNPQSGKNEFDIESSKMFIDNLEMLEFKTKGNLSNEEDRFLKSVLTQLRMDFVEALESHSKISKKESSAGISSQDKSSSANGNVVSGSDTTTESKPTPEPGSESVNSGVKDSGSSSASDDKRKFVKKYD